MQTSKIPFCIQNHKQQGLKSVEPLSDLIKPRYKLNKVICPKTNEAKYELVHCTEEIKTINDKEEVSPEYSSPAPKKLNKFRLKKIIKDNQVRYCLTEDEDDDESKAPGEIKQEEEKKEEFKQEEEESVPRYNLNKYYDESESKFKFKLTPQPVEEIKKVVEEPRVVEEPKVEEPVVKSHYALEKILDKVTGISKYILKEVNKESTEKKTEETKENFSVQPVQEILDVPESVPIRDLAKKQIVDVYRSIIKRKNILNSFRGESKLHVLLGENNVVYRDFSRKTVLDQSHFLNTSSILDFISVKVFTNNLNTMIQLDLNLYYFEIQSQKLEKIAKFQLGEFSETTGKILSKTLDFITPPNGCFLIAFLDAFTTGKDVLESGTISIEFVIETVNKKSKDRLIQIPEMNKKLEFY